MKLHTDTNFAKAVQGIFKKIAQEIPDGFNDTVHAIVAGGVAVHYYTGSRTSHDLDAEFSHRMILPQDLVVIYQDNDDIEKELIFDTNYTPVLGLIHEDYVQDAVLVTHNNNFEGKLSIYVLSPVDLAVSKISRYADNDKSDIEALAREQLFTAQELEARALEALSFYIGSINMVRLSIEDAVNRTKKIQDDLHESIAPR